jgi:hypothetical protein
MAHCGSVLGSEPWPEPSALDLAQETGMSIEAHLAELERRHRDLEAEIAEARAHPSIDDLEIVKLKRRKLLLKDEIVRLQNWRPIYVRSSGPPPTLRESGAAMRVAS